ncbi:hypothetical protein AMTR_s00111p00023750 [Amborella trichopoda]|uniref:Uncharacterized protein n=1 Tax=Amborella trichopoda TaxID=13333 RepID=W1NSQ3_AMBTC|nr:hypothetical protein AMTR_s00111p00023750 [Amborella trichopoda]
MEGRDPLVICKPPFINQDETLIINVSPLLTELCENGTWSLSWPCYSIEYESTAAICDNFAKGTRLRKLGNILKHSKN